MTNNEIVKKVIEEQKVARYIPFISECIRRGLEIRNESESSLPSSELEWLKEKPEFKEECVFITATWWNDHWEYQLWEIEKMKSEEGYYLGVCDESGGEWGEIADLHADLYKVIPPLPVPPQKD